MSGLAWFKCYPRDFNEGMAGLTLEERGAYVTLLNLIYARGGPIPEDVWWITSQLGCTRRTWVKVRAALIVKRKMYAVNFNGDDCLMNARAADEILKYSEISQKFSAAGKRGGRNSTTKRSKNKGKSQARLKPGSSQAQAITDTESEGRIEASKKASIPTRRAAPEARLDGASGFRVIGGGLGEPAAWADALRQAEIDHQHFSLSDPDFASEIAEFIEVATGKLAATGQAA